MPGTTEHQMLTVGAAPFCDLVIDQPAVSSQHCGVSAVAGQLQVMDLGSTNGTWVNQQRLAERSAVPVTSRDRITLGRDTPLTWDHLRLLSQTRLIRIGRDSSNDVVLADDRVSAFHARLLVQPRRMTLIDLQSANGTSVGRPNQRCDRQQVMADDRVWFASTSMLVSNLLTTSTGLRSLKSPPVLAGILTLVVLLTGGLLWRQRSAAVPSTARADETTVAHPQPSGPVVAQPKVRLEDALYSVVMREHPDQPGLRIGTAWAKSDQCLVTSGSVVLVLQDSATDYPYVSAVRLSDGQEIAVTDTKLHPACRSRVQQAQQLTARLESLHDKHHQALALLQQSASSPAPPSRDEARRLTDQIVQLNVRLFDVANEVVHCDIGLLQTKNSPSGEPEGAALPLAMTTPAKLQSVTLAGAAFPHDQSIVVDGTTVSMESLPTTVHSVVPCESDHVPRLLLSCRPGHQQQNWLGAPVLNQQGEVVGVYSRPVPSEDPNTPPSGHYCDVVSVARLAAFDNTKDQAK